MLRVFAVLRSLLSTQGDSVLQKLIARGRHSAMRWGRFSDVRPTPSARALLGSLATAGDVGLEPEDYDATQLSALATTLDRGGVAATVDQLQNSTRAEPNLQSIEPPWSHYQLLKRAIAGCRLPLPPEMTRQALQAPSRTAPGVTMKPVGYPTQITY